jgi:hypothetical protein
MQNTIALVEPAGLGIDQVLQGTAGDGGKTVLDDGGADLIDASEPFRVE